MDVFIDTSFTHYYEQSPLTLVDVGARGGLQSNWQAARKHLRTIGFEPDPEEYARLKAAAKTGSSIVINAALYNEKASVDFHLTKSEGASSLFKPNRQFLDRFPEADRFNIIKTIPMSTDTLDNQLLENNIRDVDFIKTDTQGSELFILGGAKQALETTVFGLEIEVEFSELYQGQPLFSDVDSFVRKSGFALFDIRPHYWKRASGARYGKTKGQLVFADALYFRTSESFSALLEELEGEDSKKSKTLKALSVCILYGYLDYALEIFEAASSHFTAEESNMFLKRLEQSVALAGKLPNFRGRGRVADIFYLLYKKISPAYRGWATSGKAIGNLE